MSEGVKNEKGSNNRAKYGVMLDDAYQRIKQMMYYNQLVPGQKIIYADLAKQLNTSITPVVQSLKRLESSKIVRYFPNKGYFVTEVTETEVRELYEARETIEIAIAPKIIERITSDETTVLKEYIKSLHVTDPRELGIFDQQFHLAVAKYARNDVIYDVLKEIFERIYLRYKPQHLGEQRFKENLKEHREIFNSVAKQDVKSLCRAIRKHLANQLDYTIHYILKK